MNDSSHLDALFFVVMSHLWSATYSLLTLVLVIGLVSSAFRCVCGSVAGGIVFFAVVVDAGGCVFS